MPSAVIASWSRRARTISRMAVRVRRGEAMVGGHGRAAAHAAPAGARQTSTAVNVPFGRPSVSTSATTPLLDAASRAAASFVCRAGRKHVQPRPQKLEGRRLRLQPGGPIEPQRAAYGEVGRKIPPHGGVALDCGFEQRRSNAVQNHVTRGARGIPAGSVAGESLQAEQIALSQDIAQQFAGRAFLDQFHAPLLDRSRRTVLWGRPVERCTRQTRETSPSRYRPDRAGPAPRERRTVRAASESRPHDVE